MAATLAAVCLLGFGARAQEKLWPVKVYDFDSGKRVVTEYSALPKAAKPWRVCVLFPHMKDTFWVAVDYGVVQQAREEGVDMTLYQAGGYTNLPKQLSQFDDCMASNYDAILIGAISEAGVSHKVRQAVKQGMTVISTVNPVAKAPFTSKFFVDFTKMGDQTGHFLVNYLDGKKAYVVAFPGPSGSGWADQFVNGFKEAITTAKNVD
ncbi:MAG: substrate-binding domain-containing protein, partial [Acetobacteraceae bacterium]